MDRRDMLKSVSLGGAAVALAAAGGTAARAAEGGDEAATNACLDRMIEAINSHNVDLFDKVYSDSAYTNHQALIMANSAPANLNGRAQAKAYFAARFKAFPDVTLSTDIRVVHGDLIAANLIWTGTHKDTYLGIPATGKKAVWNSTDILRVKNGLFVEHWGAVDFVGLTKQLKA
ncbi:MAG TPA: ester cyclase [Stellaceae bacterium]|nr:ester cyclase [Stellaceae bacterium]